MLSDAVIRESWGQSSNPSRTLRLLLLQLIDSSDGNARTGRSDVMVFFEMSRCLNRRKPAIPARNCASEDSPHELRSSRRSCCGWRVMSSSMSVGRDE